MKCAAFIAQGVLALFATGCTRKHVVEVADPARARVRALYAKQDASFGDRNGAMDASMDIERGTPKLYRYGFPPEYQREWAEILRQRFSVLVEYIAGCEASPRLVNFADAYDARVLAHIAEKFGPNAYDQAREDAVRQHNAHTVQSGNQAARAQRP